MKIQYMSDLHLEFGDMPVPDVVGDVLVLAGDIHIGANAIPWIEQCSQKFEHVIYILGNHEYYGQKMWKLPDKIRSSIAGYSMEDPKWPGAETLPKLTKLFDPLTNVYFLDNECVEIDGVNFIGSTLWSIAAPILNYRMNDFMKITYKFPGERYGKFSTQEARALHSKAKRFIQDSIKKDMKNVVITHHAPSFAMINQLRYSDQEMNSGYATEILPEFEYENYDVDLWISGHTHHAIEKVINGIHSVSNCRGYVPYEPVENFNPCAMVEI